MLVLIMKLVNELFFDNPVDLAVPVAERMSVRHTDLSLTPMENYELVGLDDVADNMGFIGQRYLVASRRGLSLPRSFEADEPVEYKEFQRTMAFRGEFACYSKVVIGEIIGRYSVKALCLSFNKFNVIPWQDDIPSDHLLHVPVLAVASINVQTA